VRGVKDINWPYYYRLNETGPRLYHCYSLGVSTYVAHSHREIRKKIKNEFLYSGDAQRATMKALVQSSVCVSCVMTFDVGQSQITPVDSPTQVNRFCIMLQVGKEYSLQGIK